MSYEHNVCSLEVGRVLSTVTTVKAHAAQVRLAYGMALHGGLGGLGGLGTM